MSPEELLQAAIADDIEAGRLLEIGQVAKRIKRSPETVRAYVRSGRLFSCRAGTGHYLIPHAALAAFLTRPTKHHKTPDTV